MGDATCCANSPSHLPSEPFRLVAAVFKHSTGAVRNGSDGKREGSLHSSLQHLLLCPLLATLLAAIYPCCDWKLLYPGRCKRTSVTSAIFKWHLIGFSEPRGHVQFLCLPYLFIKVYLACPSLKNGVPKAADMEGDICSFFQGCLAAATALENWLELCPKCPFLSHSGRKEILRNSAFYL